MKYIASRNFETVTGALNFTTSDCHIVGNCDLYTTKAAKNDKKLYKSVEKSLEAQHESLLRLSASLSPPQSEMMHLNLSRSSPFGPLTEVSNRRTFAYLIATLNASHPDYDFSDVLKPTDFKRERSLRAVMSEIDDTMYNLRPRSVHSIVTSSHSWSNKSSVSVPHTPGGTPTWSPRMWTLIDDEMTLRECDVYRYSPREDPFEAEGAIWSMHFFIFNKTKKRVAYIHVRGLSILSHSPTSRFSKASQRAPSGASLSVGDYGASKRARFWLGDQAEFRELDGPETVDDFEDGEYWDDADAPYTMSEDGSIVDNFSEEDDDDDEIERRFRQRSSVRGMSEELAATMDP